MSAEFVGTACPGGEAHKLRTPPILILKRLAAASLYLVLLAGAGCKSIGPSTVKRDRLHYSSAVTEFWKEQLLLNIVKTRYGDAPAFLEVASVVAGYSLETGVSLNGQFSPESLRGDTFAAGGVSGTYTDRPIQAQQPKPRPTRHGDQRVGRMAFLQFRTEVKIQRTIRVLHQIGLARGTVHDEGRM